MQQWSVPALCTLRALHQLTAAAGRAAVTPTVKQTRVPEFSFSKESQFRAPWRLPLVLCRSLPLLSASVCVSVKRRVTGHKIPTLSCCCCFGGAQHKVRRRLLSAVAAAAAAARDCTSSFLALSLCLAPPRSALGCAATPPLWSLAISWRSRHSAACRCSPVAMGCRFAHSLARIRSFLSASLLLAALQQQQKQQPVLSLFIPVVYLFALQSDREGHSRSRRRQCQPQPPRNRRHSPRRTCSHRSTSTCSSNLSLSFSSQTAIDLSLSLVCNTR